MVSFSAPPEITESPLDTAGVLGDEVQLFCEASGAHPLNISWNNSLGAIDDNGPVLISTSQISDNTTESELTIPALTAVDESDYTCTASNDDGDAVSSIARLRIQRKRKITCQFAVCMTKITMLLLLISALGLVSKIIIVKERRLIDFQVLLVRVTVLLLTIFTTHSHACYVNTVGAVKISYQ